MSLYDELGVPKTADAPTIKKAYRRKAQKAHPDKGGDQAKFYAIQRAYDVLGDAERRRRYDDTGDAGEQQPVELQAMAMLADLILQIIEKSDVEHQDIVGIARENVKATMRGKEQELVTLRKAVAKREKVLTRMKFKGNKENMVEQIIRHNIADHKRHMADIETHVEGLKIVLKMVSDYEYKFERASNAGMSGPLISSMSIFEAMQKGGGFYKR